ncbi:DUF3179 domain-containing protein [soil metagenome]
MRNSLDQALTRRKALALLAGLASISGIVTAAGHSSDAIDERTNVDGDTSFGSTMAGGPAIGPDGHFTDIQIFGDGTKHLIPIEEIVEGGPDKDDIPSIDNPQFVGPEHWADVDYRDDGWVIGVEVNGERRAYPFQVLVWHEIVNDRFDGVPLLVTYCPLCGSGIVFRREIDPVGVAEFGVTGRLYNSDMLMYDRATNSVWSQLTGTAVIGELTGQRLEIYPSELLTWADFKQAYPDSQVLSRDTGFPRNYDSRPYGAYDETITVAFPVAGRDDRLHPKTRITGVELDGLTFGAYPDNLIREHGPVNTQLDGVPLLVVSDRQAGGSVRVFERRIGNQPLEFSASDPFLKDEATGSRWNYRGEAITGVLAGSRLTEVKTIRAFWFAWYAFHHETELWQPET